MTKEKAVKALQSALGSKVITQKEELYCYSFDATPDMPNLIPDVVVIPENTQDIIEIVKIAREYNFPIYPRGAGTNLSGGCLAVEGGIVLSMVKMNKILDIDPENMVAVVQPGVIIQDLNQQVIEHGLIYPPDPGTVKTATMGGSVSENSGGLRGLKYGVTSDYVMGLEIVNSDARTVRFGGKTVKNVSGYDMVKLFTGAEGTLGIITEITVKLIPTPAARTSMLAIFSSLEDAGNSIRDIINNKVIPATLEIMDSSTIKTVENFANAGLPTDAKAVLLIEVDGIQEVVDRETGVVDQLVRKNNGKIKLAQNEKERDELWTARRAALPALAQLMPTTILEDATVPRSKITEMLLAVEVIAAKYDLNIGTFGHAGDGNLHPTILTNVKNEAEMGRVKLAIEDIFKKALELGGTLSGEHGIGMAKAPFMLWQFGEDGMEVMGRIKKALDPDNIFNPGKLGL